MPTSTGFNHVATVTADLDRVVAFYRAVFDAQVTFEMAATGDHPRMAILDLGGGSALNVTEQPAGTIVGDRTTPGGRARSTTTASRCLPAVPSTRCATDSSTPAPTSATSNGWATAGPCSSATPTAWNSRCAPRCEAIAGSPARAAHQTPSTACTPHRSAAQLTLHQSSGAPAVVVRHLIRGLATRPNQTARVAIAEGVAVPERAPERARPVRRARPQGAGRGAANSREHESSHASATARRRTDSAHHERGRRPSCDRAISPLITTRSTSSRICDNGPFGGVDNRDAEHELSVAENAGRPAHRAIRQRAPTSARRQSRTRRIRLAPDRLGRATDLGPIFECLPAGAS